MENKEQTQPELTIADLQNIRVLVEMAVRRGAYSANEMSSVGAVFDRLNGFLNAVSETQTAENPQTAE